MSSEVIRKEWDTYKTVIDIKSQFYDIIWEDWYKKFNIDKKDVYVRLFKRFIEGDKIGIDCIKTKKVISDGDTIIIKGLDCLDRKEVHILCDKIGLHHNSKFNPKKPNSKFLYIYKPLNWLWEHTDKNPYSKSDEYYKQNEIKRKKREDKMKDRMNNKYCEGCGKTGLEVELYTSVYMQTLYCDDCLETMSDDNGGKMKDHKFEPVFYGKIY